MRVLRQVTLDTLANVLAHSQEQKCRRLIPLEFSYRYRYRLSLLLKLNDSKELSKDMQSLENNTHHLLAQEVTKPPWMSLRKATLPPTEKQQKQHILPSLSTNLKLRATAARISTCKALKPPLLFSHNLPFNEKTRLLSNNITLQHRLVPESLIPSWLPARRLVSLVHRFCSAKMNRLSYQPLLAIAKVPKPAFNTPRTSTCNKPFLIRHVLIVQDF